MILLAVCPLAAVAGCASNTAPQKTGRSSTEDSAFRRLADALPPERRCTEGGEKEQLACGLRFRHACKAAIGNSPKEAHERQVVCEETEKIGESLGRSFALEEYENEQQEKEETAAKQAKEREHPLEKAIEKLTTSTRHG